MKKRNEFGNQISKVISVKQETSELFVVYTDNWEHIFFHYETICNIVEGRNTVMMKTHVINANNKVSFTTEIVIK